VSDRLLNHNKQNQITSLQMQFETQQQEKEIKQLSTENSLREYELKAIEKSKTSLQLGIAILTVFTVILIWGYRAKSKANKVISQQYKQLEQAKQKLHQIAITDPLTQLFNRRAINDRLENELVQAKLTKSSLCLCFMDLDNFKLVNDNYGHDFGDYVLTEVANILQLEMRQEDVVGRWGGEEFFILLTDSNVVSAESILRRVLGVISKYPFTFNAITLQITATIGFSIYQESVTPLNDVMKAADDALYEGKKLGRNQVIVRDIR
jgi:polar amino acid transport system substrate-binding protein